VTPPVLAAEGVRIGYPGGFTLDVPALDVHAGEVLAVIGPNGGGKSTLLRVLALLERPDAGAVRFHGRPVDARDALGIRRRMAVVFQDPLLADMSVADNVALGLRFRGVAGEAVRERTMGWLERFNIAPLAGQRARTLSGGQAQRAALARALVLEPEVLLLDEPFASLDEPTRATLVPDLGGVLRRERVTTVLVTHDRGEAQALADRVAVLLDGRLGQVDETARVFRAPASEEVARFVGVETIVTGRVVAREAGVTLVEVGGHRLEVATEARPGERVRVAIRPEDVTVVRGFDGAGISSARNAVAGVVARLEMSPTGTRLVLDCGFPLVAAVTARSVAELGLAVGTPVHAVFKASAAHLIPYAGVA